MPKLTEQQLAYQKAYREKNKEILIKKRKDKRLGIPQPPKQKAIENIKSYQKKYREHNPVKAEQKIKNYIYGAKKRGIEWKLSWLEAEYLMLQPCWYCGQKEENKLNGIDRFDNNKYYTDDNVVPCCGTCNFMKGKLTLEKYLNNLLLVANTINLN
jgi:hypothetical protein